eukprot:s856_g10.t1
MLLRFILEADAALFYMVDHSFDVALRIGSSNEPTKTALGSSYAGPTGQIEPSPFVDDDAEAVKAKHLEEVREEEEINEMSLHDKQLPAIEEAQDEPYSPSIAEHVDEPAGGIFDDVPLSAATSVSQQPPLLPGHATSSQHVDLTAVPQTPQDLQVAPVTPRSNPSTRVHDVDVETDDHDATRARVDSSKKQRLERISMEYMAQVRAVKISDETLHTMNEYNADLSLDDHDDDEDDVWYGEDDLKLGSMPKELCSHCSLDQQPPEPESWVDRKADQVELNRLSTMCVLAETTVEDLGQEEQLTTKFVYDWRQKEHVDEQGFTSKKWFRRSRLVARGFSFWEKRGDTYSPASSTHILNLLPMLFLQQLSDSPASDSKVHATPVVLGTVDIKDAFLVVDQQKPMSIKLFGKYFKGLKYLPGLRLGAKAWYWHFRAMLTREFGFEWCLEQPCLARNSHCCLLIHVDDVLFCGDAAYWENTFLKTLEKEFKTSHSQLSGIGSEISFLKRRLKMLERGGFDSWNSCMEGRAPLHDHQPVRWNLFEKVHPVPHKQCWDHYLLVDSSSARQIATRQGPGKLKHFAGKLLWIQQSVLEGQIQMVQIPTAWNISDLGTKPLGGQRIKLLLRMLNASKAEGLESLGAEEYAVHIQKHGSMKQIKALSKSRVLLILGHEPGFVQGAAGMMLLDDDGLATMEQCPTEPSAVMLQQQHPGSTSWTFMFLCIAALGLLVFFLAKVYKLAHDAFTSFEPLYVDVSALESLAEAQQKELTA